MPFKMTKIIATLGPASGNRKTIDALVRAGVNIFRLNMSHGNYPDLKKPVRRHMFPRLKYQPACLLSKT